MPFKAARRTLGQTESSLAVQSVVLTSARFIGFAAAFAIPLVLIRVFGQTDFGTYKQVFLIAVTLGQVLTLGLPASIFYFLPRDSHDGHRYLVQALGLVSLMAAVGAGLVLLGGPLFARSIGSYRIVPLIPVLALLVLVQVPSLMAHQPPVADRRAVLGGSVMAGSDILRAGAIILAALLFRSIAAVVMAAALIAALRVIFLLAYITARRYGDSPGPSWSSTREQLSYSLSFWVALLFQVGLRNGHAYFVMAVVPTSVFAIYAVGIFQLPVVAHVVDSVAAVMIVRASEAFKSGDFHTLRGVWKRATLWLLVGLVPVWAGAQFFAGDLILVLFGPTYVGAVPVFRIFLTFLLLRVILDHGILRATGDTAFLARANAAGFLTSVIALPLLTQ